jgi:hypothetical protein
MNENLDPSETILNKMDPLRRDLLTPLLPATYAETVLEDSGIPPLKVEEKVVKRIFVELDQLMVLFPDHCAVCGSGNVENIQSVSKETSRTPQPSRSRACPRPKQRNS